MRYLGQRGVVSGEWNTRMCNECLGARRLLLNRRVPCIESLYKKEGDTQDFGEKRGISYCQWWRKLKRKF